MNVTQDSIMKMCFMCISFALYGMSDMTFNIAEHAE